MCPTAFDPSQERTMQPPTSRRYPKLRLVSDAGDVQRSDASSYAALTDLTTTPLGTSTSGTVVKPNILFILDGSGSMNWDFSPDNVNPVTCCSDPGTTSYTCRVDSTGQNACGRGDPPFQADMFNGLAYNPQTTYRAGINYNGVSRGNMGSPWTSVPVDNYWSEQGISNSTINLVTGWNQNSWCTVSGCSSGRLNGVHNAVNGTFAYAAPLSLPSPQ
jgi:type IV pilus assembly protein PilY1